MKRLKIRMMVEMYLYKTCMSSTNEMFRADETAIVIVFVNFLRLIKILVMRHV